MPNGSQLGFFSARTLKAHRSGSLFFVPQVPLWWGLLEAGLRAGSFILNSTTTVLESTNPTTREFCFGFLRFAA